MNPRDIVALVLAATVALVLIIHTTMQHFAPVGQEDYLEQAQMWLDFLQIIIGGLIGYMAGRNQ